VTGVARARQPRVTSKARAARGLVYVSDAQPGIRRLRVGRGFCYRTPQGRRPNAQDLARIRALAIPPAYTEVWICCDPRGHLQATGRDARRRKQYRYHAEFRRRRDAHKFERMLAFAQALPRLRRGVRADLARPGLPRRKVLALVVVLLGRTLVRVGNDEYAQQNRSFGLTTLRDRHVRRDGARLRLAFRGKGGREYAVTIDDPRLTRLVQRCQSLPGQTLFQYRDRRGHAHAIDSDMVNAYLRELTGAECSAKDFRTWGGTLAALAEFGATPPPAEARAQARLEREVICRVAAQLGNTPAVCRASYVHPAVIEAWRDGRLQRSLARSAPRTPAQRERWALRLLARARLSPAPARPRGSARSG
jgi:DNA topoisomerase I